MSKIFTKKTLLFFFIVVLVNCLSGCGQKKQEDQTEIRVGSLKGPTSMGIVYMMEDSSFAERNYTFTMATQADELVTQVLRNELDLALVPANVASVLYAKTEGKIQVVDINTLGVLYLLTADEALGNTGLTAENVKGKTVYLPGMGTTPDYALRALLREWNLTDQDVHLEYKSEAAEVAAILSTDEQAIGLLPQPFVTSARMQNDKLKVILDLNQEFENCTGKPMVTGVSVVRKEFLEQHEALVKQFIEDHETSVKDIQNNPQTGATYVVAVGILPKEPIALKALPDCNLTCIKGMEMKEKLQYYYEALYEVDPKAVGGKLPTEEFYYIVK